MQRTVNTAGLSPQACPCASKHSGRRRPSISLCGVSSQPAFCTDLLHNPTEGQPLTRLTLATEVALLLEEPAQDVVHGAGGLVGALAQRLR